METDREEGAPLVLRADRLDATLVAHLSRIWVVIVREDSGEVVYELYERPAKK